MIPSSSTPNPPQVPIDLGTLIGEYHPSYRRYVSAVLGIGSLYLAVSGTIGIFEFDTGYRIFWGVFAAVCTWQVFSVIGANAKLYERGFVISLSGQSVTDKWESVAKVSHVVKQSYFIGFIPEPWKSHEITVSFLNGRQLFMTSNDFQNIAQMGSIIQHKWAEVRMSA